MMHVRRGAPNAVLGAQVRRVALRHQRAEGHQRVISGVHALLRAQPLALQHPLDGQRQVDPKGEGFVLQRRQRALALK